jgi:cobalamin 5'-phosphate synthase/cobalamin synthase
LLAAIAFLTRIPVPGASRFDTADVARSAGWFPLVGLLLGFVYSLTAVLLKNHLPSAVVAVLIAIIDALLTGCLHLDGLADTADGFGGATNSGEALRIMRDHAIGSYGGVALALAVALRVTVYSALLKQANSVSALVLTPVFGRWSILLLTATLPYARPSASVIQGIRKRTLLWGTCLVAAPTIAVISIRACIAIGAVVLMSTVFGLYCKRRIGGITGDTLGANLQLCESISLLAFIGTW